MKVLLFDVSSMVCCTGLYQGVCCIKMVEGSVLWVARVV